MSSIEKKSHRKELHSCVPAAACALMAGFGAPTVASAYVIEISQDGRTVVYDLPAVITESGAMPIVAAARPASRAPRPGRRPPAHIAQSLANAASDVQLSPVLLEAVAWAESRFNQRAVSRRGARGVMQLMPGTAADLGVDASDMDANIKGGARYLKRMLELFDGDLELALAAYNAGPNAVRRHNGMPPYAETRAYVARVMDYMADCA